MTIKLVLKSYNYSKLMTTIMIRFSNVLNKYLTKYLNI